MKIQFAARKIQRVDSVVDCFVHNVQNPSSFAPLLRPGYERGLNNRSIKIRSDGPSQPGADTSSPYR